ncbi:MAG: hypothetical protein KGH55_02545 [Nanoarchaeota archaeon]|nr:hypothetical protein [Nanoarchaeota archaeon]
MKNFSELAKAYALKNAMMHEGKAQVGAVISSLFHEGLKREEVKKYAKEISEIVSQINSMPYEEQKKEFENIHELTSERESREGLPELPGAKEGKVIMRFRPAPSGPMHVGHIISNLASSMYVKKYGGKFYVIIDDTDPGTAIKEAYENIKKDCDWVFGNVYRYLNASDRLELYYKYAESLIKKDAAYICTCEPETFRKFVTEKKNCPCRNLSAEKNLGRWREMMGRKGFGEGKAVLRFKSSMKHKNPAMRDFPLARINEKKHPLQGNKYRVWPLMNLAVAVDDMELKMTHVIRGKDHRDNAERQKMIFKVFKKKYPWTFFIGRIKFTDLILSKRKISAAIESGEFSGWEDEKLPTIASLRKRGYRPEAFARFIEQRGLTEVDKVIDSREFFRIIDQFNKSQQ